MQHPRPVRGISAILLSLVATALFAVGSVAAHTQTVNPNGGDAGWVNEPIARPWVQGHCHAQAPAVVGAASDGVVSFFPAGYRECSPTITNPGGQVTGP